MCAKYGITHQFTPRNHPQANPVESSNKNIKTAMRAHLINDKNHAGWEKHLRKIIHDLNTSIHTTTKVSPQYLQFGRILTTTAEEHKTLVDVNTDSNTGIHQQLIQEEIRHKNHEKYEQRREKHNRTAKQRHFNIGDVVYIPNTKLSNKAQKYNRKLAPVRVQGHVKAKFGNNIYLITNMRGNEIGRIHASDITRI